jgi:hypothetical protein
MLVETSDAYRLVSRLVRGSVRPAFSIDGPFRVEREDVPAEVVARILGADVQFQGSVLEDPTAAATLAHRTCVALAKALQGAVHDPQRDEVVWPRAARRRAAVLLRGTERVDALELQWTTVQAPAADTVAALLDLVLKVGCRVPRCRRSAG